MGNDDNLHEDAAFLLNEQGESNTEDFPVVKRKSTQNQIASSTILVSFLIVGILFGFGLAKLVDSFNKCPSLTDTNANSSHTSSASSMNSQNNPFDYTSFLLENIEGQSLRKYLQVLTMKPHVAGSEENTRLASYVKNEWEKLGIPRVELNNYTVLLQYPNEKKPNTVTITDKNMNDIFISTPTETPRNKQEESWTAANNDSVLPAFNAYSAPGAAEGELVYVNYGRQEDFDLLKSMNINMSQKIAIARYGKIFRGDKAALAEKFGFFGLIIYSDPQDYSRGEKYPDGLWLPSDGFQRGTLWRGQGDPATPDSPSLSYAPRLTDAQLRREQKLPSIPVMPISADDAKGLLCWLGGGDVPDAWQGGFEFDYKLGPGFDETRQSECAVFTNTTENEIPLNVRISVRGDFVEREINNVIGYIPGKMHSHQYILLGSHRDAWVAGATDPSSGQAALLTVAKALGAMYAKGWRPLRTIVLCSWDAEEYGLLGSGEWTQEYATMLSFGAIAYLNVDIAVQGIYTPRVHASPLLQKAIYAAAKKIPSPKDPESTFLYDTWLTNTVSKADLAANPSIQPNIGYLGSGSDYAPFLDTLGIPAVDIRYTFDSKEESYLPIYHSVTDDFDYIDKILDPTYAYHVSIAQMWAVLALDLDKMIIPFDANAYATTLNGLYQSLVSSTDASRRLDSTGLLRYLNDEIQFFTRNAQSLTTAQMQAIDCMMRNNNQSSTMNQQPIDLHNSKTSSMNIVDNHHMQNTSCTGMQNMCTLNHVFTYLERAFLIPAGLTGRPYVKHAIFAPSSVDGYQSQGFPGIVDALSTNDSDLLKDQLFKVICAVRSARMLMAVVQQQ